MSTRQSLVDSYYPETCPICEEELARPGQFDEPISQQQIYRRHRRVHFRWGDVPEEEEGQYLKSHAEEHGGRSEECDVDTQTFTVDIHYEMVEQVTVEARDKREAIRLADHEKTYHGDITQTLHEDAISYSEPSQASDDYLKKVGLLPTDGDNDQ